ncbi:hypothetical protein E2C01_041558 [Portunus trituberculatus]|uniref:Uncharacterized protein n=1 Tax=Portunus trituberculatus TaxID=210409 RepID=A0A5B7FMX5_PORTR|nr:hypothetical protein [Portunus trituberculatus]
MHVVYFFTSLIDGEVTGVFFCGIRSRYGSGVVRVRYKGGHSPVREILRGRRADGVVDDRLSVSAWDGVRVPGGSGEGGVGSRHFQAVHEAFIRVVAGGGRSSLFPHLCTLDGLVTPHLVLPLLLGPDFCLDDVLLRGGLLGHGLHNASAARVLRSGGAVYVNQRPAETGCGKVADGGKDRAKVVRACEVRPRMPRKLTCGGALVTPYTYCVAGRGSGKAGAGASSKEGGDEASDSVGELSNCGGGGTATGPSCTCRGRGLVRLSVSLVVVVVVERPAIRLSLSPYLLLLLLVMVVVVVVYLLLSTCSFFLISHCHPFTPHSPNRSHDNTFRTLIDPLKGTQTCSLLTRHAEERESTQDARLNEKISLPGAPGTRAHTTHR